jgi:hypothetical protein
MEVVMELSRKTTILLPPGLHDRLTHLAQLRQTSLGQLVRAACEQHYGLASQEVRLAAARKLRAFSLPVADPATMKAESVPVVSEDLE